MQKIQQQDPPQSGERLILRPQASINTAPSLDPPALSPQESVRVHYPRDLAVISNGKEVLVVEFLEVDNQGQGNIQEVTYRSRYAAKPGQDSWGEGKVFEHYQSTWDEERQGNLLTDLGGELFIKAGNLAVEWSWAGNRDGWLYFDPDVYTVTVKPKEQFATLNLSQYRSD